MAQNLVTDPLAIFPHISHLRMATLTGPEPCLTGPGGGPSPLGPHTALALSYHDSGRGAPPVPRPFLGGVQSGYHAMPAVGDSVLVAYQPKLKPTATLSAALNPEKLDVLNPGESFQRHADGRLVGYLYNTGASTLYSDTHGVSLAVSAAQVLSAAAATINLTGTTLIRLGAPSLALVGSTFITGTTSITGDTSVTGALTFNSQTLPGSVTLTGTVSGTTCTIVIPGSWNLNLNGTTHKVALLT
jgi:hypothetical protein